MIGKTIRNYRHLLRSVGNKPIKILFYVNRNKFVVGEVIKYKSKSSSRESIVLFQNYFDGMNSDSIMRDSSDSEFCDVFRDLANKYRNALNVNHESVLGNISNKIILLPDDFEIKYLEFTKSNRKLIEGVSSKIGIDIDSGNIKYLYTLSHETPNLFIWAIKNYGNRVHMSHIERILKWNNKYSHLSNKLSKGTITGYNGIDGIYSLLNQLSLIRRDKRANDSINLFNTMQKKLLKDIELTDRQLDILGKFNRLTKVKQVNFVRKMSTISDANEIFHQMSFLVDIHFEWNKESFLEYINKCDGINCDIIIDSDTFVLVKTKDYETIKKIAKNTNWCISKNKKYWNDYVGHRYGEAIQYVLCDFTKPEDDKLSIVGFTTQVNRGVTNAHNFVNDNLMYGDGSLINKLSCIYNGSNCGINDILKEKGISLKQIGEFDDFEFSWNRDSFLEYLNTCVDEESYNIYYDTDNKLVLSVDNSNIKYIFGETYIQKFGDEVSDTHFLFLDFNDESSDRLLFGFINYNNQTKESYCHCLYDEYCCTTMHSFDMLLEKYGLPYNIICRTDSHINRFMSAVKTYDTSIMNKMLGYEDVRNLLMKKEKKRSQTIYAILEDVTCNYKSFDYLNVIYQNGLTLGDILDISLVQTLMLRLFEYTMGYRNDRKNPLVPINEQSIKDFHDGKLSPNNKLFIGQYLMLKMIMDNEHQKGMALYSKIARRLCNFDCNHPLMDVILHILVHEIDFSKNNDVVTNFIKVVGSYYKTNLLEILLGFNIKNKDNLNLILSYTKIGSDFYYSFLKQYEECENNWFKGEPLENVHESLKKVGV